jgi:hypothetical protein
MAMQSHNNRRTVNTVFWLSMARSYKLEDLLDRSSVYEETAFFNGVEQGWANSGPRATYGPLRVFLCPAKTEKFALNRDLFSIFGSTYICEKRFSCLKINKSKYRCSLTGINLQAVMRISTSNLTPDFKKIVENRDKVHLSH